MKFSRQRAAAPAALLVGLAFVAIATTRAQVTGLRALKDHSQCCAIGMPSIHGADGTFDPAPDPVLNRRRAPAPPAPRSSSPPSFSSSLPGELPPLVYPTRIMDGHLEVGFDFLAGFPLTLPSEAPAVSEAEVQSLLNSVNEQIPELVRKLDGKKVVVRGFMLPMKMEGVLATEFALMANSLLCCYGVVPPLNQWITVVAKAGVSPQQDVPLEFFGTLRIRPRIENGVVGAIYHLEAAVPRRAP